MCRLRKFNPHLAICAIRKRIGLLRRSFSANLCGGWVCGGLVFVGFDPTDATAAIGAAVAIGAFVGCV